VDAGSVAGGTLQTGQRVGGAIGTALLPGLFYLVLADDNASQAVAVALAGATAVVLVALAVAVLDRRAGLRRDRAERATQERGGPDGRDGTSEEPAGAVRGADAAAPTRAGWCP
jgi:hypothetical protein